MERDVCCIGNGVSSGKRPVLLWVNSVKVESHDHSLGLSQGV